MKRRPFFRRPAPEVQIPLIFDSDGEDDPFQDTFAKHETVSELPKPQGRGRGERDTMNPAYKKTITKRS